jgi:hypothetical protein
VAAYAPRQPGVDTAVTVDPAPLLPTMLATQPAVPELTRPASAVTARSGTAVRWPTAAWRAGRR